MMKKRRTNCSKKFHERKILNKTIKTLFTSIKSSLFFNFFIPTATPFHTNIPFLLFLHHEVQNFEETKIKRIRTFYFLLFFILKQNYVSVIKNSRQKLFSSISYFALFRFMFRFIQNHFVCVFFRLFNKILLVCSSLYYSFPLL